jgi:hypothetical protein
LKKALLAKTAIQGIASPAASALTVIQDRKQCTPAAASLCYAQLLQEVGKLADENGRLAPDSYRGLSAGDTERVVTQTLEATDIEALETALRNGACEPVDFLTPLEDTEFYSGVDVQPGHVVAGLVVGRPEPRRALEVGLASRGAALIAGPSGAGKSAILWDTAHALRHTVRWYRLLRVDQNDLPALRRLARTLRASPDSPVGFVVDDVGRRGAEGWDALTLEFAAVPGVVLFGSIREEDLFLLSGRSRAVEVRAEPDDGLAQRVFEALTKTGKTAWAGWREPWARSQGLMLEYVHILTEGQRFGETLAGQVDAREQAPDRAAELAILRVVSLAGAAGTRANPERLPASLDLSEAEVRRSLRRLVDEHLVLQGADGHLTGLHQLRSAELVRLTHAVPPPLIATTFGRALDALDASEIELLIDDGLRNRGVTLQAAIPALRAKIEDERALDALSSALRGLGTARIWSVVAEWLASPSAEALPRTQVRTAGLLGISGADLGSLTPRLQPAITAGQELGRIRANAAADYRQVLLDALSPALLTELLVAATDAQGLDRFLSTLNGLPLHPVIRAALRSCPIDVLNEPLDDVVRLLGTLAILDRDLAIAWVDEAREEALLNRMPRELAWATRAVIADTPKGRVIQCDYNEVGIPGADGVHGKVVRICEVGLALSPRSDIAASTARAPNGEPVGFRGLLLADKRIPRANLPAAAGPDWNRRWLDAIAFQVGSPTYSGYLSKAACLLDRLAPALERTLSLILQGKSVPAQLLATLNHIHEGACELTPPTVGSAVATGQGAGEAETTVTKLQNLLFAASTDVCRRFRQLPEGAGAYLAWIGDLITNLDDAQDAEPWGLVGSIPSSLVGIRRTLVHARIIAGHTAGNQVHPAISFANDLKRAKPANTLRFLGSALERKMEPARQALAASILQALDAQSIRAQVHVVEDPDAILPWPPSKVLLLVPVGSTSEIVDFERAATEARKIVPSTIRLTGAPSLDGLALPSWGLSGYESLLPLPDAVDAWIEQLGLPTFRPTVSPMFDLAVAQAAALQSMDRLGLGVAARPPAELDARGKLESDLVSGRAELDAKVCALDRELGSAVDQTIDRIRSGETCMADAVQEFAASQLPNEVIIELAFLRAALDYIEYRSERSAASS